MLQNEYFLAKIGADTAENEQYFAEILPKINRSVEPPGQRKSCWLKEVPQKCVVKGKENIHW